MSATPRRHHRRLALAIAMASLWLSACDRQEKFATAEAAEAGSTPASAPPAEPASSNLCAEGDIQCDERMMQLEETLFAYEASVMKHIAKAAQSCWKLDSDTFRKSVDDCKDIACKENALLTRLSSLHSLQPRAQRAEFELPQTPQLLTVLAADITDEVSSGARDSKPTFETRGGLIHASAHPEHMGIAVSAAGKDHVFIFEMDIGNQSGQDEVLGLVGSSPTTQVLVRGHRADAPTGIPNFDSSECRWVYELADIAP